MQDTIKKYEVKEFLAKSLGINIADHSNMVQKISTSIAETINPDLIKTDPNIAEAIRIGSLLHDIGKCTVNFQKKIKGKNPDEENLEVKSKFRHNEIGWAFLSRNLNLPKDILDIVLDLVYWHHGISNTMCKHTDIEIEDTLTQEDKDMMLTYLLTIVDESCVSEKALRPVESPKYYYGELEKEYKNTINTFARTCLISADRMVSSVEWRNLSETEIKSLILDKSLRNKTVDIKTNQYFGKERFTLQTEIVDNIEKTTIVKAPAGFGKTLIGLLYSLLKSNKKLIWVCPRNMIARSVYKSIIEELNGFEKNDITVELFLSGEVEIANHKFNEGFNSDIIITNIDNYLNPSVDNRTSDRLYTILNADVVFDEFHELIGETPLFSCFLNLMRVRHQMTNSKTILLSATPSCMEFLWETTGIENTTILPNAETHYPAQHDKKYAINLVDSLDEIKEADQSLVILNSVKNTQNYRNRMKNGILIHSYFEESDRKRLTEEIYNSYGKDVKLDMFKPDVVGTHILQASLDISFKNVYDSVISPETTLQRFGRCDRWGWYLEQCSMNFLVYPDKGEDRLREVLYSKNLSYMWIEHLRQFDGKYLTLDEFYCVYNKYNSDNKKAIQKYLIELNRNSIKSLSTIHPEKIYLVKPKGNKGVFSAAGNKIRMSAGFDRFIIAEYSDGSQTFSSPFTVNFFNRDEFYNEVLSNQSNLLKKMKYIRNQADDRFDYNSMIEACKIDLKIYGKKSNTPHIRPGFVYDKILGLKSDTSNLID